MFHSLAKDANVQIRKAASENLKHMMQRNYPKTEAIALFKEFSSDPQDLIRYHCVDSLVSLCQTIPSQVIQPQT